MPPLEGAASAPKKAATDVGHKALCIHTGRVIILLVQNIEKTPELLVHLQGFDGGRDQHAVFRALRFDTPRTRGGVVR